MKPTQGKQYLTQVGDNLKKISARAYGDPNKWPLIKSVNQIQIRQESAEEIPSGVMIIIPFDAGLKVARDEQLRAGLG